EPTLGRFLQADSIIQPESVNGMNRYMYVDGNPVSYTDASGNRISTPLAWGLMGALTANQFGLTQEQGFLIGYGIGNKIHRDNKKSDFEKATFLPKGKGFFIQLKVEVSQNVSFDCDSWNTCSVEIGTLTVFMALKIEKIAIITGAGGGGCDAPDNGGGHACSN
ncbi:RHS repeat-associated core domain-containing protein, partial [Leptospira interrogans]